MKRIIITGAHGQLGLALKALLAQRNDIETLLTGTDSLDITDRDSVLRAVTNFKPDFIINTAAYTAVDKAEQEPEKARLINTDALSHLADAAALTDAKIIHISTDYVFSGTKNTPYNENDSPDPLNVYGRTKLDGEKILQNKLPKQHIILRTAWLYSTSGRNFVKTMLTLAAQKEEINVVADQWGSPTYAPLLANAIIKIIDTPKWRPGTYHVAGAGRTTWFDFAKTIFNTAGIDKCRISPVTTTQYNATAQRPAYSVLDTSLFSRTFKFEIPDWQQSLKDFFQDF